MRARTAVLTTVLCFAAAVFTFAFSNMGTWKLNEAKSKMSAGSPKNNVVVYESAGDQIKVTVDGVDRDGKPTHNEWTGKMDGKDYPLAGDPSADTRAYKVVDDHTTDLTNKKNGKVVATARIVISADGKSRTVTLKATDASGKEMSSVAAYDKQ